MPQVNRPPGVWARFKPQLCPATSGVVTVHDPLLATLADTGSADCWTMVAVAVWLPGSAPS